MGGKRTEACGRCAMSAVVDATADDEGNRDPFDGGRIEVDERRLRAASPGAWVGRLGRRLDAAATRLIYDR